MGHCHLCLYEKDKIHNGIMAVKFIEGWNIEALNVYLSNESYIEF